FYVGSDAKNSEINVLHLAQGGLHLPDIDYYLKTDSSSENILKEYQSYIDEMLTLAGDKKSGRKAKEILEMETALAKVSMSRTDRRDPEKTYNRFTYPQFLAGFASADWNTWFQKAGIPDWEYVIINQPEYLNKALAIWNETALETRKSYLKLEILSSFSSVLNQATATTQFHFYST